MPYKMDDIVAYTDYRISPLIFSTLIVGAVWFIQYRWERRRLYELMGKMKKPMSFPIIGHLFLFLHPSSKFLNVITQYFFKYGPNFAVWVAHIPLIVIGKPEDLEIVMHSPNCIEKSKFYDFTKEAVGNGLFTASAGKWKIFRKLLEPTFHSKILKSFIPAFSVSSRICVDEVLPKFEGRADVDWTKIFTNNSLDTFCKTAMGVDIDAQRQQSVFGNYLHRGMNLLVQRMTNVLLYPTTIYKLTPMSREFDECHNFMKTFTLKVLTEKKADLLNNIKQYDDSVENEQIVRKPFLELLLELDNNGVKLTDVEIMDEIATFFVGGTDTTSGTVCFFLSMMGMHQEIQQKAYEEIVSVLGADRCIDVDDYAELPVLERCLKETLRLFPPVPVLARRVHDEEVQLGDCTLPVGANLVLPLYYTHRCPEYWDEPLKYNPDRFLPENVAKRHLYAYMPFARGLRNCIGLRYARMNLLSLLSMIIRKYKVYCDVKSVEEIDFMHIMAVRPKNPFKFYLKRRD